MYKNQGIAAAKALAGDQQAGNAQDFSQRVVANHIYCSIFEP
jgi:hypothetical protein